MNMVTAADLQQQFPFLTVAEWNCCRGFLARKEFAAGQTVYAVNDTADSLLLFGQGRYAVQKNAGFAGKKQAVALLSAGSLAGEGALAGIGRRQSNLVCLESGWIYFFPNSEFLALEEQHPAIALKIFRHILLLSTLRLQKNSERLALVL